MSFGQVIPKKLSNTLQGKVGFFLLQICMTFPQILISGNAQAKRFELGQFIKNSM